MSDQNLQTYLNDHLGGSEVALALLTQWPQWELEPEWKRTIRSLYEEIQEDQDKLREFIAELALTESPVRKLGGKVAGRIMLMRNQVLAHFNSDRVLLETLDLVLCGIFGKRAIWKVLSLPDVGKSLDKATFLDLIARAEDQIERLEAVRLEVASNSLSCGGDI